jgi:hypothetical protein
MRLLIPFLALASIAYATPLTIGWEEVTFQMNLLSFGDLNGVSDPQTISSELITFANYLNKTPNGEIESLVDRGTGFFNIRNIASALANFDGVAEVGAGAANFGDSFTFASFEWLLTNTNMFYPTDSLSLTLSIPESGIYLYNGLGFNNNGDEAAEGEVSARLSWAGTAAQQSGSESLFRLSYDGQRDEVIFEGEGITRKGNAPCGGCFQSSLRIEPYNRTQHFGNIPPGGTLRIVYQVFASGSVATGETGFFAFIGDPAQLNGGSAILHPTASDVPEPGSAALMGAGLLVLLSSIRRIHASHPARHASQLDHSK